MKKPKTPKRAFLPDPLHRHELRWWKKNSWSELVMDQEVVSEDPLTKDEAEAAPGPTEVELAAATADSEVTKRRQSAVGDYIVSGTTERGITARSTRGLSLYAKGATGSVEADELFITIRRNSLGAKMRHGWTTGEKRIDADPVGWLTVSLSG